MAVKSRQALKYPRRQWVMSGLDADLPAAGIDTRLYWATDTEILYRDTGLAWVETARGESVSRLVQLAEKAHGSLTGVTADLHHAQAHTLASHSTKAHAELTNVTAAQHHAKYTNAEAVAACEAAGLDLATGKNINLISNLTADNTWSGLTAILQAGENLTITQLVYVKNDGKMWKAKADAAATMPCIAMACGTINANAWGEFLLLGFFRDDGTLTFVLGDMLYVSDTVAGAFDNVLPADAGEQVQVLGKCLITTHIIYFNPSLELVEIS